jgi:hypothetical protein
MIKKQEFSIYPASNFEFEDSGILITPKKLFISYDSFLRESSSLINIFKDKVLADKNTYSSLNCNIAYALVGKDNQGFIDNLKLKKSLNPEELIETEYLIKSITYHLETRNSVKKIGLFYQAVSKKNALELEKRVNSLLK